MRLIPEVEILSGSELGEDYPDCRLVPFRQDWLDRLTSGSAADVFLTRGQGDSMMPTILHDDDVLVNRADNVVRSQDRIWAVRYGELGMIKRVRRLPGGQFMLNSDNPAVSPDRGVGGRAGLCRPGDLDWSADITLRAYVYSVCISD